MRECIRLHHVACGWRSGNFGDMFSAEIVSHLGGCSVAMIGESVDELRTAEMVAVGSLAQHLPLEFTGHVWGTGLMFEHAPIACRDANVTALRGKLTASRWPKRVDCALGDPGLLIRTTRPNIEGNGRWRVGIVPHYVDMDDPMLADFLRVHRADATAIDPCSVDMPEQMARCEVVLSSSLHGLVTADALGIPNAWIVLSEKVQGGSFKFRDYMSVFGVSDRLAYRLTPGAAITDIQNYVRDNWTWGDKVKAVCGELLESFPMYPEPPVVTDEGTDEDAAEETASSIGEDA